MNEDIFNVDFFWFCLLFYKVIFVDILFYWIFEIKKKFKIYFKRKIFFIYRLELIKNWSIFLLIRLD